MLSEESRKYFLLCPQYDPPGEVEQRQKDRQYFLENTNIEHI